METAFEISFPLGLTEDQHFAGAIVALPQQLIVESKTQQNIVWSYGSWVLQEAGVEYCWFKDIKITLTETNEVITTFTLDAKKIKTNPTNTNSLVVSIYDRIEGPGTNLIAQYHVYLPTFACKNIKEISDSRIITNIFSDAKRARLRISMDCYRC